MPTLTPAEEILTATSHLHEAPEGDIPQSQYDKGVVDKFIAILNTNAKNHQSDAVLRHRVQTDNVKEQRVAAATVESDENVCLNKSNPNDAPPKEDMPAANTRSRVGSSKRSVI